MEVYLIFASEQLNKNLPPNLLSIRIDRSTIRKFESKNQSHFLTLYKITYLEYAQIMLRII
jgi:hypothetical protein